MTDLTRELLAEKVAQCADALSDLKKYQSVGTIEYLRAHPDTYYAVCYRFIAAIESLFDIGQYILASRGLRANSQREIPTLLAREKLITDDLANKFENMYGFRNRLFHAYGTLDDMKVAAYLADQLVDIEHILTLLSVYATHA
jgi:uncharacterized protein YutE (UPF0331/DUF86 family)